MMYFLAYLLIGSIVSYGIFTILKELFQEFKYVYSREDSNVKEMSEDSDEVS
jgi:hypothetical protein|tara:strand:+ start:123 stop:278 length:156 start_codon:yes stop_codon:yes gene_type:complete